MILKFFKEWLQKEVGVNDYRIFKSYYLKVNKNLLFVEIIKDRTSFILRILVLPIFIRYKKLIQKTAYMIEDEESYLLRKQYILIYDGADDVGLIDRRFKSKIYITSFSQLVSFFKNYITILLKSLKLLFLPVSFSILPIANFFLLQIKIKLLDPQKIYMFYSYLAQNYLMSLYISNRLQMKVDYIIGNMIHESLRYSFFQRVNLCFVSLLYKEEYLAYKKIGWIEDDNRYVISGKEFNIQRINNNFQYDIGFFSSAYWARREGLYTDNNIIALRENRYQNNIYSLREIIIFKNLIKIVKKYNLSLKIYLHPYEKRLITEYGVYPPYWDKYTHENIVIDGLKENNNFFESKVGVLLQSSIFYDRWEHNLFTLCYQFKNSKNRLQIPLKYLGKYNIYGFENLKELETQVLAGLKYNE